MIQACGFTEAQTVWGRLFLGFLSMWSSLRRLEISQIMISRSFWWFYQRNCSLAQYEIFEAPTYCLILASFSFYSQHARFFVLHSPLDLPHDEAPQNPHSVALPSGKLTYIARENGPLTVDIYLWFNRDFNHSKLELSIRGDGIPR